MENEILTNQSYNKVELQEDAASSFIVILQFLRRFIVLIVLATLFGLGVGVGYAYKNNQTIYTQTKSVLFIAKIDNLSMASNFALTNKYMSSVPDTVLTPVFISKANEIYRSKYGNDGQYIYAGAIGFEQSDGMIFSVSYTDGGEAVAERKLDAFIEAVQVVFEEGKATAFTADEVSFEPIDNTPATISSNSSSRYILIGLLGGVVGGVLIALIIYLLDNTVNSKTELERLTGATVVAYIDDIAQ